MRLARLTAATLALLAVGCSPDQVIKGIGSAVRTAKARYQPYSWKEEMQIGGTVAAKIAATYPVVDDSRATEYVNLLAATLSNYSTRPDVQPKVLIVQAEHPNAFACPAGYMFVTTELLKTCQDESELAGILGHELAHVCKKHSLAGLSKKRAWRVAGDELSTYSKANVQKAYNAFSGATDWVIGNVVDNRHGSKAEQEADELGTEWAARAGYDPTALGRLIARMKDGDEKRKKWLENFSVYKNGDTRAQHIIRTLKEKGLPTSGGVRNAERYRRELAGVRGG